MYSQSTLNWIDDVEVSEPIPYGDGTNLTGFYQRIYFKQSCREMVDDTCSIVLHFNEGAQPLTPRVFCCK